MITTTTSTTTATMAQRKSDVMTMDEANKYMVRNAQNIWD